MRQQSGVAGKGGERKILIKKKQVAIWANAGTISSGPPAPMGFGRGGALVVANFCETTWLVNWQDCRGEGSEAARGGGGDLSPGWRWGSRRPRAVPAFLPAGSRLAGIALRRDRGCLHLPSARGNRHAPSAQSSLSPSRGG